jgi:hypothetical protein
VPLRMEAARSWADFSAMPHSRATRCMMLIRKKAFPSAPARLICISDFLSRRLLVACIANGFKRLLVTSTRGMPAIQLRSQIFLAL